MPSDTDTTLEHARRLIELREKATAGEWSIESVVSEGDYGIGDDVQSGFDSYKIVDQNDHSIVDALNSEVSLIEDDDEAAIDVVGRANSEFISHAANHAAEVAKAYLDDHGELELLKYICKRNGWDEFSLVKHAAHWLNTRLTMTKGSERDEI